MEEQGSCGNTSEDIVHALLKNRGKHVIKYDFLTISALSKQRITLDLLIENEHIEQKATLKETYYSVLDPHHLDYDKPEIWDLVANNEVMDLFQFDSIVAMQTVGQIKPRSLVELAQTNSLMRLQPQDGAEESPTETYVRYSKDISLWYEDMDKANVPKEDQTILEEVLLPFNGVADTQETLMALSRLKNLTNFSVGEAHQLRSVIGKKQMDRIPEMKAKFFERGLQNGVCENTLNYVWNSQFMIQMGYSFSVLHVMCYSFVAIQELVLYNNYPSIYWNTATLTVNSGSLDDDEILYFGDENEELDDEIERIKSKNKSTDYGKVAAAIGSLQHRGVKVELPLINKASLGFVPDEENNRIIFGLKGIMGIGDDIVDTIINLRPYESLQDFYDKVSNIDSEDEVNTKIGNSRIRTLIKAGAFDELEGRSRVDIMKDFVKIEVEPRVQLDFRSITTILEFDIIPEKYSEQVRMINFRNHVLRPENRLRKDSKFKSKSIYTLSGNDESLKQVTDDFFEDNFMNHLTEDVNYWYNEQGDIEFYDSDFKRCVDKQVDDVKNWLNTDEALELYNHNLQKEHWDKHCSGSISKWEMDSVSFYAHEHELQSVNKDKYNIVDFDTVSIEPEKVGEYTWRGRQWDELAIYRIVGTVLDRDNTKHTVSLLTTTGVTTLKMYGGAFSHYDRQVTESVFEKGKQVNKVVESSWFTRGTLLSVVGFRRGDLFIPKKYRNSVYQHTIQKITDVDNTNGDISIQSERKKV